MHSLVLVNTMCSQRDSNITSDSICEPLNNVKTKVVLPATDALQHTLALQQNFCKPKPRATRCCYSENSSSDEDEALIDISHYMRELSFNREKERGLVRSMAFSEGLCHLLFKDYARSVSALPASPFEPIILSSMTGSSDNTFLTKPCHSLIHQIHYRASGRGGGSSSTIQTTTSTTSSLTACTI